MAEILFYERKKRNEKNHQFEKCSKEKEETRKYNNDKSLNNERLNTCITTNVNGLALSIKREKQ